MNQTAKLALAFSLGFPGMLLLFLLGEGIQLPATLPAADYLHAVIVALGLALYFLAVQRFLSRGHADAVRRDWPLIGALNAVFLLVAAAALIVEPNKGAALQGVAGAAVALLASFAGAGLAAHAARKHRQTATSA